MRTGIIKLLETFKRCGLMKDRKARFVCVIAVVLPDGDEFTVRGTCEGYIGFKPEGKNGFGYDPLFYVPEFNITNGTNGTGSRSIK